MTWPKALRVDAENAPSGWWGTIYPIGGVYLTVSTEDPSISLGFGTWSLLAKGRFLMAPPGPQTDISLWVRRS